MTHSEAKKYLNRMKTLQINGAYFRLGRGGKFYNQGHKSFVKECVYDDFVSLITEKNGFLQIRNEKGKFCIPFWVDGSGNKVADVGDYHFIWDGEYDTDIFVPIAELSEEEANIVIKSNRWYYANGELSTKIKEVLENE